MFEVFYTDKKGASIGKVCGDEQALIAFVSQLRRQARIMSNGQHIGRVWKDGNRWQWFYDPARGLTQREPDLPKAHADWCASWEYGLSCNCPLSYESANG